MNVTRAITATSRERAEGLPGDELILRASGELTHAITVKCSARELWPWLIQMGADRAGWYSYDRLDNGGRRSAEEIDRDLQNPPIGSIFPALPGGRDGFVLVDNDPSHWMVLAWPAPTGAPLVTWTFVVREIEPQLTRLIIRVRASEASGCQRMPKSIGLWFARVVHFIMERKQLIEMARRAEGRVPSRTSEPELLPF